MATSASHEPRDPSHLIVRAAAVVVVTALALWFVMAITMASVFRGRDPATVLAWWPYDAGAKAALAYSLLQRDFSPANRRRAIELSKQAFIREPINVAAARTLGLVTSVDERQHERARAIMTYAQSLSRRDVPTQLWLLEDQVAQDNIPGALLHYDRALRVSEDARALLLPVLVQASAAPGIAPPLARLVEQRPPWWYVFAVHLTGQSRDAPTLAFLVDRLRLDANDERERNLILRAIQRLIDLGAFDRAYALYRKSRGLTARSSMAVANGDFESNDPGLPPFDWHLAGEGGFGAFREPRDGAQGRSALTLSAESGRSGEVARQLLILPPGRYRLSALVGEVGGDPLSAPQVAVLCAVPHGVDLMRAVLPQSQGRRVAFQQVFTVPPSGCPGQWLSLNVRADLSGSRGPAQPWVDSLSVSRN